MLEEIFWTIHLLFISKVSRLYCLSYSFDKATLKPDTPGGDAPNNIPTPKNLPGKNKRKRPGSVSNLIIDKAWIRGVYGFWRWLWK